MVKEKKTGTFRIHKQQVYRKEDLGYFFPSVFTLQQQFQLIKIMREVFVFSLLSGLRLDIAPKTE